jgi:hypothetical protein
MSEPHSLSSSPPPSCVGSKRLQNHSSNLLRFDFEPATRTHSHTCTRWKQPCAFWFTHLRPSRGAACSFGALRRRENVGRRLNDASGSCAICAASRRRLLATPRPLAPADTLGQPVAVGSDCDRRRRCGSIYAQRRPTSAGAESGKLADFDCDCDPDFCYDSVRNCDDDDGGGAGYCSEDLLTVGFGYDDAIDSCFDFGSDRAGAAIAHLGLRLASKVTPTSPVSCKTP